MENPFELILEKLNTLESLIRNQKSNGIPPDTNTKPDNEIFTINQTSEFLHLAKSTIYKMTSDRTIPHFKMKKRIYFKRKV
ncbi:MAG: helix-turn-helix domain-containing protein [Sphingobacteriia bacterium]|nr:helix-turn-helix domain-containing protein [Sphingobacteriia bacterium]